MPKIKKTEIDEKYLWMGGAILVIIIVIFAFGRLSGKKSGGEDDPSDANPNINPITVNTESGSVEWNPSALVKKVHTAYEVNWVQGRCEVLEEIGNLQDVQIRALADGYQKVYGKTLRRVLEGAWSDGCWSGLPYSIVISRLDALQIP